MDLDALRTFVAVAEELHFGRAADRLHLAQQAVSQQIQRLERSLDARLFHRTTRRVALTQAGEVLLADAHRLLDDVDDLRRRVESVASGRSGSCRLGYDPNIVTSALPPAIQRCRSDAPTVTLELTELCPPDLERRLLTGGVDLAIAGPSADLSGLEHLALAVDRPLLVAPLGHGLISGQPVELTALAGEPIIGYNRDVKAGADDLLMHLFELAGVDPSITQRASSELAVLGLVAAGCGLGIVSGHAVRSVALPLALAELEPSLDLPTWLLWVEGRTDGPADTIRALIAASASL